MRPWRGSSKGRACRLVPRNRVLGPVLDYTARFARSYSIRFYRILGGFHAYRGAWWRSRRLLCCIRGGATRRRCRAGRARATGRDVFELGLHPHQDDPALSTHRRRHASCREVWAAGHAGDGRHGGPPRSQGGVVDELVGQIEGQAKRLKVEVVVGEGRLAGPRQIEVVDPQGDSSTIEADAVILATGSVPFLLPNIDHSLDRVWTSDEATALSAIPSEILIIGGGVIGLEFADAYANFGSTRARRRAHAERAARQRQARPARGAEGARGARRELLPRRGRRQRSRSTASA